jgi:hypothetical protein
MKPRPKREHPPRNNYENLNKLIKKAGLHNMKKEPADH